MKFGAHLIKQQSEEWRFYYIDYDQLKHLLKAGTADGKFSEKHEATFIEALERELEKVASFSSIKADELQRRVQRCEESADAILKQSAADSSASSSGGGGDEDAPPPPPPNKDRFRLVEDEISRITTEVGQLSNFVRLNYSGFLKILKKHDKHTAYALKAMFMVRLNAKPFYKQNFDNLIIRLSKLYDTLRTGGKRKPPVPPSGSQSFVRRTTKYWVHPDNITEVKIHVLKNLPVLVFTGKGGKEADPAVSSVYFDNDAFELYLGRLEKHEGAEAIRLRWYGNMDQTEIFIERKTHREDWTGATSVKARFPMKEKHVNDFLAGKYTMDRTAEKLRASGAKKEKEIEEMLTLSREVQKTVLEKGHKPMIRTFYNRTAFQLPGDARVRISLDNELTMIREDNFGRQRSGSNWRRMDAGTIAPFAHLPEEDVCAFPYAILEVKLEMQQDNQAPQWVDDLVKSHLVEEVPKFSKFIHGVATLLENRVSLLPFWLPQMDKDIRKPASSSSIGAAAALPSSSGSSSQSLASASTGTAAVPQAHTQTNPSSSQRDQIEVVIDDTTGNGRPPASAKAGNQNGPADDLQQPLLGEGAREEEGEFRPTWARSISGVLINTFEMLGALPRGPQQQQQQGQGPQPPSGATNNSIPHTFMQKRIALPVRVEPKVFFANERTFLSWLHFCIVLGGLALGLLNFGDTAGQISGCIFTLVAIVFMVYAISIYHWRAHKIRIRDPGPYDDRLGPTILVIVLFCAVVVNFYLKFTEE